MRTLGFKATLATFRWDLVYLGAQLVADKRPGVAELAVPIQAGIAELAEERAQLEAAEDQVIVGAALLNKADKDRDDVLLKAGGVARATDKQVYAMLFPKKSPSATARLPIDEESLEIARILAEMAKLPIEHPIRATYEQELTEAEAGVKAITPQTDAAATSLALRRSSRDRLKVKLDQLRLATYAKLVVLLKEKAEAEAFFRPTASAPGAVEQEEAPSPVETPVVPG